MLVRVTEELNFALGCICTQQVPLLLSDLLQHVGIVLAKYT